MRNSFQEVMHIQGINVAIRGGEGVDDFISLTDLARHKADDPSDAIRNWMRNRNTIEFLGVWETINNPDFKPVEFDGFKKEAGLNSFTMTPTKWITATNAKGITVKRGRNGGTYAHIDIALDFATWISAEFRLYVFQEYKRLKADETSRLNIEWQKNRLFSALNYRIHTDAVRDMMPVDLPKHLQGYTYAKEAEMLNLAVFGTTSKDWHMNNPDLDGNIRDYASATQLLILHNLEAINAMLVRDGLDIQERFRKLQAIVADQLKSLDGASRLKQLEAGS